MTLTDEQARAAALALMAQHPCEYERTKKQVNGDLHNLTMYMINGLEALPERIGTRTDLAAEFKRLVRGMGVDPASGDAQAALADGLAQHKLLALSSPGGVISYADAMDEARGAAMTVAMPPDARVS